MVTIIEITPKMIKLLDSVGSNNHDAIFAKLMKNFNLTDKQAMRILKRHLKEKAL